MPSLPEPYWQSSDGVHRLYHGDCLELLPLFEAGSVDAVVTDPPYEGMKGGTIIDHAGVTERIEVTRTVGNELGDWQALAHCRRISNRGAIVFCSFHKIDECAALLGGSRKALVTWYKRNSPYSVNNSPWYQTEFAWAVQYAPGIKWNGLKTLIDIPMLQAGCMANERFVDGGKSVHPAQKPIAVMDAVLLPGMDSVCDPYAGLGTTGVAAIRKGRRCILIEKEEKYCQIAAKRLSEECCEHASQLPFNEPSEQYLFA